MQLCLLYTTIFSLSSLFVTLDFHSIPSRGNNDIYGHFRALSPGLFFFFDPSDLVGRTFLSLLPPVNPYADRGWNDCNMTTAQFASGEQETSTFRGL